MSSSILLRNRRILSGILGGVVGRSISLIAPFIVMPIILHALGLYLFGLWMTILSFTSMALFMDFGIGNGLLTRLSYANGLNNNKMMSSYITSAYVSLFIISAILLAIIFILYLLFTYHIIFINIQNYQAAYISLVSLIIFVLGIPVSIIQRVMYAKQQAFQSNIWQILAALLSIVLCFMAVKLKFDGWVIIFCYSFPPIVILFVSTLIFFKKNNEIRPKIANFSKEKSLDLLKIGSKFLVLSILTSIALNIDNMIIAYKLGAQLVTDYAVPAKVASLLGLVITTIFLPLWAANGEAIARKDYAWVTNTTKKMMLLGAVAVALLSMVIITFDEKIMTLWMGRQFKDQQITLFFLCFLSLGMAITSPLNMLLNSLGSIGIQVKAWLIFTIVSVGLKVFFLTDSKLWLVACISSFSYFIIIVPMITYSSLKVFKGFK